MNSQKNALVLWGSWIWAKTAEKLAEKWHHVTVVVQSRVTHLLAEALRLHPGKMKIIFSDLRIKSQVESILQMYWNNAHIFQFAARAFGSSHTNGKNPTDFDGNAQINDNVIGVISNSRVRPESVNFSSSYFTYDAFWKPCPQAGYSESDLEPSDISDKELAELKTRNPYKWEKIRAEKIYRTLESLCRVNRFRFGNVKGEHQRYHATHFHLVPRLFYLWNTTGRKNLTADIYGDGTSTRAWVDVNDIARGILHIALNSDFWSEVWNIGGTASGEWQTTEQIIDAFWKGLNTTVIKNYQPEKPGWHSIGLNTSQLRATGWLPEMTVEKSMKLAADWYINHGLDSRITL